MINKNYTLKKLRLLQLSSSNLPIGNFTYSQGLEFAVQAKWVYDINSFKEWQIKQIYNTLKHIDLPVLKRLYIACKKFNINNFKYWIYFLLSTKETYELRQEEIHKGISFFYLIRDSWCLLDNKWDKNWHYLMKKSYLGCLGWIGSLWKLPLYDLALSFSYSWIENAIMTALKIIPFGQNTAQKIIKDFCIIISTLVKESLILQDKQLGSSLPLISIASSLHEIQSSRLFRS